MKKWCPFGKAFVLPNAYNGYVKNYADCLRKNIIPKIYCQKCAEYSIEINLYKTKKR